MQKLRTRPAQDETQLIIPIAGQEFEVAPVPKAEHKKLVALIGNISRIGRGKRTRGFQSMDFARDSFQKLALGSAMAKMRTAGLNRHQINSAAAVATKWHLEGLEATQAAWSELGDL